MEGAAGAAAPYFLLINQIDQLILRGGQVGTAKFSKYALCVHVLGEGSPLLNHHQQERSTFTLSQATGVCAKRPSPSSDTPTTELPTWKKRKETGKNAS
jgi:hypothetical protein